MQKPMNSNVNGINTWLESSLGLSDNIWRNKGVAESDKNMFKYDIMRILCKLVFKQKRRNLSIA